MTVLPHEKGFHVSWDQVHRDSRALAWRLDNFENDEKNWNAIIAITRGGLTPAMIIARELDIRTVDTISIRCYEHKNIGKPQILKMPHPDIPKDSKNILIIDDLVDTGTTLKVVRELYPNATYSTVYAKPEGKPLVDVYITEVSQDTWIYFPWDMALHYQQPYRELRD